MTVSAQELIGRSVGPYVLDRLIGEGGFAWVFEAHEERSPDPVALKLLKFRYAGDREFEARFRDEFTLIADFEHPNLVSILDVGHHEQYTFFAMPLYPDSLSSLIERQGPLDEERLVPIASQVAAGLAFAHERGVVHRDIKGHRRSPLPLDRLVRAGAHARRRKARSASQTAPGTVPPFRARDRPLPRKTP